MTLHCQSIGVGGRRGTGRRAGWGRCVGVLGAVGASVALAACVGTSAPVEANPVIAFTLDSAVPQGDSIHGEVVATGDGDLTSLAVTVFDTVGKDTTGQLVNGGTTPSGAAKLDAKFAYKVLHTAPGGYVRFSAIAFNSFGDSTIVRDSTRVTP
jgi:hypothetical protein